MMCIFIHSHTSILNNYSYANNNNDNDTTNTKGL